jgi:hypothetical protein
MFGDFSRTVILVEFRKGLAGVVKAFLVNALYQQMADEPQGDFHFVFIYPSSNARYAQLLAVEIEFLPGQAVDLQYPVIFYRRVIPGAAAVRRSAVWDRSPSGKGFRKFD